MKTYYEILSVNATSTADAIKRAFRKRAKEIHPDVNPFHESNPEVMQKLLQAYETLMDPIRREDYDRRNFIFQPELKFDYREFLKSRPNDESIQSRLVFFDLLHQREDDALALYDRLAARDGFSLDRYLDREDYMDCAFLLAEEYEFRLRFRPAFELLLDIVELEHDEPYFRHFFVDVTERIRTLVCFKMPTELPPREVIEHLNRLIVLELPTKDIAFYLKKAAELYLDIGDSVTAATYLQRGLQLDEKLAGTKKLRERLAPFQAV
ncbi:MAG: J domain-containing protein [Spirochaetales bacterium]|nr:J domain-containing protein [Spirochaetales bacterium]